MTLIEALVVVALTVTTGAILFPGMIGGIERLTFGQSAALLAADLRQGRADALRQDRRIDLRLGPDGRGYAIGDRPARSLPPGLRLAAARSPAASFYADGSATSAVVDLAGARGAQARLAIDAAGAVSRRAP